MRDTAQTSFDYSNQNYSIQVPLYCPYCGKAVESSVRSHSGNLVTDSGNFLMVSLYVKCCNKTYMALYEKMYSSSSNFFEYVNHYPNTPPPNGLSDIFNTISPRFVALYGQAEFAKNNNLFDLAGSGYRNALEVLVKDLAINVLNKPYEEVSKKSLFQAISDYLPNEDFLTAADVVRILGNDHTHYERKYTDVDFTQLIEYFDILLDMVKTKYRLLNPPVARQSQPAPQNS